MSLNLAIQFAAPLTFGAGELLSIINESRTAKALFNFAGTATAAGIGFSLLGPGVAGWALAGTLVVGRIANYHFHSNMMSKLRVTNMQGLSSAEKEQLRKKIAFLNKVDKCFNMVSATINTISGVYAGGVLFGGTPAQTLFMAYIPYFIAKATQTFG